MGAGEQKRCQSCTPSPPAPSQGPGLPPPSQPHSSLQPGPWDLQILPPSRLAWESPHGQCIVPLLPLFLCCIVPVISILHATAAAQESSTAAEATAGAGGRRPGPRCLAGGAACVVMSPRLVLETVGGCMACGPALLGVILLLGAWGEGWGTLNPAPLSCCDIWRLTQPLQVSPSRPIPLTVRISTSQFPSL